MFRMRLFITVLLGLAFSTAFIQILAAQDIDVLVTPDEAEIEAGGTIQFEVFAFRLVDVNKPENITNIAWRVLPDSMGTITEDGFFIAGKRTGKVEIEATVVIGNRIIKKVVVVVIGRIPIPFFKVEVKPSIAVVPTGTERSFRVVISTPTGKKVTPDNVRWEVKPKALGAINDDGLFTAGDQVNQGKVIAHVEIDGLTLRAAARVIVSPPATGAIPGTVVDDNGNVPLEGATVKAVRLGRIHWVKRAITDTEGKYLIGELIPGDYILLAKAKGYISEFYNDTRDYLEATILRIAEDDTLTEKDFGLSEGGKITGTVVADEDNLPLPEAHVVAFLKLKPKIARHVLTNDDGSYLIESLPKGTFVVKANTEGYKGEYYDDAQHLGDAFLLPVEEGETKIGIDFGLATTSAIVGRVTNSLDGTPIVNARIRVFTGPVLAINHKVYRETRTNENGEYLVQIRQGAYYVHANAPGFNGEFYDNVRRIKDATMVHVYPDSHTVDKNFDLTPRGAIAGEVTDQVTGAPLIGAVVEAFKENLSSDVANTIAGYRAKTDSLGQYLIENVPSGHYFVRAHSAEYLPEFYEESPTKRDAILVEVLDGTTKDNINFTLEFGGSITGFVASEVDSLPIGKALVQVWGINLRLYKRAYTHNDGHYKVGGLPTGNYYVQVVARGYFNEYHKDVRRQKDATPVHVTAPAETDSIDFYLKPFVHKRGTIAGRVVSELDSVALEGAVVVAVSPNGKFPYITFTGPGGVYELTDLPHGKYFVFAWTERYIGEFFKDAHLFRHALPVFVHGGQVTPGIDFDLTPQLNRGIYSVSGKVLSKATNAPIQGLLVHARMNNVVEVNTVTDADGNYVLTGLAAGAYKIEATGVGYAAGYYGGTNVNDAIDVTVGNGQDAENVSLSLETDNLTSIESGNDLESVPESFALFQNYPNPFNPETNIKYQVSEISQVTLNIFNVLGQEIRTLVDKTQQAGAYTIKWDGKDQFGQQVATGIYIFQIKAGEKFKMAKRMLLMK